MAANTLGEWSDGEDDFVWQFDENDTWSDGEADDMIRNINEDEVLSELYGNDDDDEVIRNINEDEVLAEGVQIGRGEKRKSDEPLLPEKDFYHIESVRKHHSKKIPYVSNGSCGTIQ